MKTTTLSYTLAVSWLAFNLQAQTNVGWRPANNGSTNGLWSVAANWSPTRVPGTDPVPGDKAIFNSTAQIPCFINSAAAPSQFDVGDGSPGNLIIANGGSLVTSNYSGDTSWNAVGYNRLARMEIQAGGSLVVSNHLWVGLNFNAMGTFVMNGGTASVLGMFGVGWSGGLGAVLINGGTLNLAQWSDTASISPLSQLDIQGGKVVITGDHTSSIANFIAGGQLTGYGGVGTVKYVYDTNNNQTVLTATKTPGVGGPYPASDWPTNINPNKVVHYYVADGSLSAPNGNWLNTLGLLQGGDQATVDVTFQGLLGKQATSANLNVFDQEWPFWNTEGLIDILVQVYGDANVLRSATDPNQGRRFQFLTGTLPTDGASTVYGGTFATNAYNSQWNWILFTITNNLQSNLVDRLIGTLRTNATGGTNYGGINGGTIRIQGPDNNASGLTIHTVAFGQHGAFGAAADINQFALPSGACPPVVDVNLAGIDFNAGYTNHLQVINDPGNGQGVTFVNNVGPAGDQRKAVKVDNVSMFLNFGITSNYLGKACNDNVNVKVCVDYYDDPALAGAGVQFGPYAYAADSSGTIGNIPSTSLVTLQGSGQWIRQSWTVRSVNLLGVNTAPLTGGPQFISQGGQVAVSRFYIAALRATGPLAGQDPLADCLPDPLVCQGVYGNYAELDLAKGITNGLDVGTFGAGSDQVMVVEEAGPANDRRLAVRGDTPGSYYVNFQIPTNALGPTTQGNLYLAITATYYDDLARVGTGFRPQVWSYQTANGAVNGFFGADRNMVLQGTGKWRDAYWEIGTISLNGVNQGPQAAARFQSDGGQVYISRLRYAVIRPCGATAGQNLLSNKVTLIAAPDTNNLMRLSWPYRAPQAVLESVSALGGTWSPLAITPGVEGGEQSVVRFGPTNANRQFFRLNITPQ